MAIPCFLALLASPLHALPFSSNSPLIPLATKLLGGCLHKSFLASSQQLPREAHQEQRQFRSRQLCSSRRVWEEVQR